LGEREHPGWGIAVGADGGLRWNLAGTPGSAKSYAGQPGR